MEVWIHAELLCLTSTSKKKRGGRGGKDAARICGILICLFLQHHSILLFMHFSVEHKWERTCTT